MKNNKYEKKFSFIRYSNCWEDTNILLEATEIENHSVGLSVASAGDNTLAMLIKNPQKVYALDINKTQLFCLELKMACFKKLQYREMLQFLGLGNCDRPAVMKKLLPELSEEAGQFFGKNPKLIKRGIIHVGKFERFFHIFRNWIAPIVCGKKVLSTFSKLSDTAEQKEYYNRRVNTRRFRALFSIVFGHKVLGNVGRDRDFYKYVEDKHESGGDIKKRFEFGISHSVNRTNPYLCYIVNRTYYEDALPLYLKEENFETIKRNIDKITIIHGDLSDVENLKFDFLNLSDIFEYMSEDEFFECEKILEKISSPGARIAYWNMQNKRYIEMTDFTLDNQKSDSLFEKNQSYFYRNFRLYRKANHE